MHQTLKLAVMAAVVGASPFPAPQGVTSKIAPPEPRPSDCDLSHKGKWGLSLMLLEHPKSKRDADVSTTVANVDPATTSLIAYAHPTPEVIAAAAPSRHINVETVDVTVTETITMGHDNLPTKSGKVLTSNWIPTPTTYSNGYPTDRPVHPTDFTDTPPFTWTKEMIQTRLITEYWDGQPQDAPYPEPAVHQSGDGQVWEPRVTYVTETEHATKYITEVDSNNGYPTGVAKSKREQPWCREGKKCGGEGPELIARETSAYPQAPQPSYPEASTTAKTASAAIPTLGQSTDGQPTALVIPGGPSLQSKVGGNAEFVDTRNSQCSEDTLLMTLKDGVLKDRLDRTAYIASNFQFQFDSPPQAGALTTAGYSICKDRTLALGGSKVFYRCPSGGVDGKIFYNIYNKKWAGHCEAVHMIMIPLDTCQF